MLTTKILNATALVLAFSFFVLAQGNLTHQRTITKTDRFEFRSGGTIVIAGAPKGSIQVFGSPANEIEVTAEINLLAANEEDLNTMISITGFATEESAIRASIITVGNHNKFGLKKLPKNISKGMLSLPFRVNYIIRVPMYSDLEIDGGKGDLSITGIVGSIRANFLESNAKVDIAGGTAQLAIGKGSLDVSFGPKSWRGRSATVQIAEGDLTIRLPTTLSAEIDAAVLGAGVIENGFPDLKPRDRKVIFTEKAMFAKAGVGGALMKFSVGDGKLKIETLRVPL